MNSTGCAKVGWTKTPRGTPIRAKLADLESLARAVQGDDTMLLLLDSTSNPFNVLAAVAVGDVDHAERVGVTVGGLNTRVSSSVEGMVGEARTQQQKAAELRGIAGLANPNAVASIAWLGYQAPSGLAAVGQDGLARIGAKDLNSFYRGLGATTTVANQDIAAFGHSYGSLTTSLALQQGGVPVDNVVLYGSPGGEITDASQLNVKPGHAYFMIGVNDGVSEIVPGFGAFGPGLDDVPGMTELGVNTTTAPGPGTHLGDGQLHERAYGHSEYARMDNDPWFPGATTSREWLQHGRHTGRHAQSGAEHSVAARATAGRHYPWRYRAADPQPGLPPMSRHTAWPRAYWPSQRLATGCIKSTTFNPYAPPDTKELDRLQQQVNDNADLEPTRAVLDQLETQIRAAIAKHSPQTRLAEYGHKASLGGCQQPNIFTVGQQYTPAPLSGRPGPNAAQWQQIVAGVEPGLRAGRLPARHRGARQRGVLRQRVSIRQPHQRRREWPVDV